MQTIRYSVFKSEASVATGRFVIGVRTKRAIEPVSCLTLTQTYRRWSPSPCISCTFTTSGPLHDIAKGSPSFNSLNNAVCAEQFLQRSFFTHNSIPHYSAVTEVRLQSMSLPEPVHIHPKSVYGKGLCL